MGWEVGGSFQREGTYVYLWLMHVDVWQKPIQYCKAIILPLKINKLRENKQTKKTVYLPHQRVASVRAETLFLVFIIALHVACA